MWLVLGLVLAAGTFGCLAYFLFFGRHSAFVAIVQTAKTAEVAVPT